MCAGGVLTHLPLAPPFCLAFLDVSSFSHHTTMLSDDDEIVDCGRDEISTLAQSYATQNLYENEDDGSELEDLREEKTDLIEELAEADDRTRKQNDYHDDIDTVRQDQGTCIIFQKDPSNKIVRANCTRPKSLGTTRPKRHAPKDKIRKRIGAVAEAIRCSGARDTRCQVGDKHSLG